MAKSISLNVPEKIMLRTVGGEAFYATADQFTPVAEAILVTGIKTILTNVWNGGGKDATEAERKAQVEKKLAAWAAGNFNIVERSESYLTAMKEAWIDEFRAANGCSVKDAEAYLKAIVVEAFGKDAKGTFGNYLDATATGLVKNGDFENVADAREALDAHYAKLADEAAKKAAKMNAKLVAPKLDLSAFKKAK